MKTKGYRPTKQDIENSYRAIALCGTEVPIDEVFARFEKDAKRAGIKLARGWAKKCEEEDLPNWWKGE